jgi:Putative sensor
MLRDRRTWTTLAYFLLMLPIGITYFVTAVFGLSVSLSLIALPIAAFLSRWGLFGMSGVVMLDGAQPQWLFNSDFAIPLSALLGVLLLTSLMHLARGVGRLHARFAKSLLVARSGQSTPAIAQSTAPLAAH